MTSLPNTLSMSAPEQWGAENPPSKDHYDNVKKKYFSTLGVNKPKERSFTNPPETQESDSQNHPRSKSNPIPILTHSPIGAQILDDVKEIESQETSDDIYVGSPSQQNRKFIPPHEFLEAQDDPTDFQVGTARSLAVWEKNRRNAFSKTG